MHCSCHLSLITLSAIMDVFVYRYYFSAWRSKGCCTVLRTRGQELHKKLWTCWLGKSAQQSVLFNSMIKGETNKTSVRITAGVSPVQPCVPCFAGHQRCLRVDRAKVEAKQQLTHYQLYQPVEMIKPLCLSLEMLFCHCTKQPF